MLSITALADALADGAVTARALVEESLRLIDDPATEGDRAFLLVAADRALAEADGVDAARAEGKSVPRFAGVPFAVKDLFDVAGEVTTAGSTLLRGHDPAAADAPVVARMREVGFILIGRTHMTEFAYSGLGLNSHYLTPRPPWERRVGRIPGGSSSGSGVVVADGIVPAALGTDTGGSCRIPAAFNGVVGYKPTASGVPIEGAFPLAISFDSVGSITNSVEDCAIVHDVLSGGTGEVPVAREVIGLRLGAVQNVVLETRDPTVASEYAAALDVLREAGAEIVDVTLPELDDLSNHDAGTAIGRFEVFRWHQDLLEDGANEYDPRVRSRIEAGRTVTNEDYREALAYRNMLKASVWSRVAELDAVVLPTVAVVPPVLAGLEHEAGEVYRAANRAVLRNTAIGNFLDACAISIPIPTGGAPVGLMLMGPPEGDVRLFESALAVESALRAGR